jgi:hypothetical protein
VLAPCVIVTEPSSMQPASTPQASGFCVAQPIA